MWPREHLYDPSYTRKNKIGKKISFYAPEIPKVKWLLQIFTPELNTVLWTILPKHKYYILNPTIVLTDLGQMVDIFAAPMC